MSGGLGNLRAFITPVTAIVLWEHYSLMVERQRPIGHGLPSSVQLGAAHGEYNWRSGPTGKETNAGKRPGNITNDDTWRTESSHTERTAPLLAETASLPCHEPIHAECS